MKKAKDVLIKVFYFLLSVLLLSLKTVRQVILPNKYRKGNLLSTLFSFSVGLLGLFIDLEKDIFRIARIFKHRYVKRILLIAAVFLFLLSSVEWIFNANPTRSSCTTIERIIASSSRKEQGVIAESLFQDKVSPALFCFFPTENACCSKNYLAPLTSSLPIWLFTRSIRI